MTFIALTIALVVSVAGFFWVDASAQPELAVEAFALFAAITGVFAERKASRRERRYRTLEFLQRELWQDMEILGEPAFSPMSPAAVGPRVYPRVLLAASDAALASGALNEARDSPLVNLLNRWRDIARDFNHRLDLTELKMFLSEPAGQILELDRALHDGFMQNVRSMLEEVTAEARRAGSRRRRHGSG